MWRRSPPHTRLVPAALSPAATVGDVLDNQNLASATVSITNGFLTGDTLAATITGTSITANYSASTGVLSLKHGSDTRWRITSRCWTASATHRLTKIRPIPAPIRTGPSPGW